MRDITLARVLWNGICFLIGTVFYYIGRTQYSGEVRGEVFKDIGLIILSASVIYFFFSWITERHQEKLLHQIVGENIRQSVRESFGRVGARTSLAVWSNYRWVCKITARTGLDDPYTRYLVQDFDYQFRHHSLPKRIRIVIGFSNDDDAGKEYNEDVECLICWEMSFLEEQPLDLSNTYSHSVDYVKINGEVCRLSSGKTEVPMAGGEARAYTYLVPKHLQGQSAELAISFFVRKINPTGSNPINVVTRLRHDCDDTSFSVFADSNVGIASTYCYTTEISPLVENLGYEDQSTRTSDLGTAFARARFNKIIQKGSSVRFELRKHDLTEPRTSVDQTGLQVASDDNSVEPSTAAPMAPRQEQGS